MNLSIKYIPAVAACLLFSFFTASTPTAAEKTQGALVVGVPFEDYLDNNYCRNCGALNVLYSTQNGLQSEGNQMWHQNSEGIKDAAEEDDHLGEVLATGDFNRDGFPDLAVGLPHENIAAINDAGAVHIIYGGKAGLQSKDSQVFHQDSNGMVGKAEVQDFFGHSLAVGDFNKDGFEDLAVGIPGEDSSVSSWHLYDGAVQIIYGSKTGLQYTGNQLWHKKSEGIAEVAQLLNACFAAFGSSLATGDFNHDGFEDLSVGLPGPDPGCNGSIITMYGSQNGLNGSGAQLWNRDSEGMQGEAMAQDNFGYALAAGDFNNDNFSDLAVGVNGDTTPSDGDGSVHIIYGSPQGLGSKGNKVLYHVASTGDGVNHTSYRHFGKSLASGDFNNDSITDLAIGVPNQHVAYDDWIESLDNTGAVQIVHGSKDGLQSDNYQIWHLHMDGLPYNGWYSHNYLFGSSLASGDLNNDGIEDLAIGIPGMPDKARRYDESGAIQVLYGSENGLVNEGKQIWSQDSEDILGKSGIYERFGSALVCLPANTDIPITPPSGNAPLPGAMLLLSDPE